MNTEKELSILRPMCRNEIQNLLEIHLPVTAGNAAELIASALPEEAIAPIVEAMEPLWRIE